MLTKSFKIIPRFKNNLSIINMKHELLSLFIAAIVAMNVYAADVWDGSSDIFTHGAGTEQSPYLIENAEQLAFIAEMVNAGIYTYSGNYFKLTTDLDLNNIPWTPIGDTEEHQFGGSFDGDNHTISNLFIPSATNAGLFGVVSGGTFKKITIQGNIPASANATNAGGLVAYAKEAITVDNCINNTTIEGNENVGGILGYAINASISHCINYKNIAGKTRVGGIIGYAPNTIKNRCISCINYGTITSLKSTDKVSKGYAGGIIGEGNNIKLLNMTNFGSVKGEKSAVLASELDTWNFRNCGNCLDYKCEINIQLYLGGVAGTISNSVLNSCYNYALITGISKITGNYQYNHCVRTNGILTGQYGSYFYLTNTCCVGGCCGYISNSEIMTVSNLGCVISDYDIVSCPYSVNNDRWWDESNKYNIDGNWKIWGNDIEKHVSVLSVTRKDHLGGIIGDASVVNVCFGMNAGAVSGASNGSGIVGNSVNTHISYCANVGNVVESGISSNANVYCSYSASTTGIIGISNGTVTNSYFITGSGNGTQKTEAQMKSVTMPILLNADSTVFMQDTKPYVNKGYPIFKNGMKYIATNEASDVSYTSATLHGNYYNCTPLSMGFEYKVDTAENYISQTVSNASPAQYELTNLPQGTTYIARYWLVDDGIKYYGDTIRFTTLACPTKPIRSDTVSMCQGESYEFAGKTLTVAGVYHDSLVATTGCDSVIELVLHITDTYKYPKTETIERGESYDFYGQLLTEPGVYSEYVRTTNRCNWIELTLIVHEPDKTLTLNVNNPLWGSVVGAGTYEHGTTVDFSAVPAEGCYFVNWSDGDINAGRTITLTKDTTITANFAIHQYTITTQATNGIVTGGGTYNYGTQITLTATANEHYHFVRWSDGDINATRQITVTENKTYTAIFEKDKFLIIFRNDDGTELKSEEVEYGVMPIAPANPTKASTAQYDYSFNGWAPEVVVVTQAATYTATYTSTVREYLVTFLNEDGSLISGKNYKYGETPIEPADPSKQATAEYTYTFAGWTPTVVVVTGNATYRATFNAKKNSYTIAVYAVNGFVDGAGEYDYGTVVTLTAIPDENYEFEQWLDGVTDNPRTITITENAEYTALFKEISHEGIDDVICSEPAHKVLINNHIYILRGNHIFDTQGKMIK